MRDFATRYDTPLETVRPRGGRLIEGFSVKLQRRIRLFSHGSFAQRIRLEAEPSILDYCERPARLGLNPEARLIDFWVRRADTEEMLLVGAPQAVARCVSALRSAVGVLARCPAVGCALPMPALQALLHRQPIPAAFAVEGIVE